MIKDKTITVSIVFPDKTVWIEETTSSLPIFLGNKMYNWKKDMWDENYILRKKMDQFCIKGERSSLRNRTEIKTNLIDKNIVAERMEKEGYTLLNVKVPTEGDKYLNRTLQKNLEEEERIWNVIPNEEDTHNEFQHKRSSIFHYLFLMTVCMLAYAQKRPCYGSREEGYCMDSSRRRSRKKI